MCFVVTEPYILCLVTRVVISHTLPFISVCSLLTTLTANTTPAFKPAADKSQQAQLLRRGRNLPQTSIVASNPIKRLCDPLLSNIAAVREPINLRNRTHANRFQQTSDCCTRAAFHQLHQHIRLKRQRMSGRGPWQAGPGDTNNTGF